MAEIAGFADKQIDFARPLLKLAIERAYFKHGPLTADPVRATGILTEEVGEAVSEALGMTRSPKLEGSRQRMVRELAQVAATAISIIASHAIESDFIDE